MNTKQAGQIYEMAIVVIAIIIVVFSVFISGGLTLIGLLTVIAPFSLVAFVLISLNQDVWWQIGVGVAITGAFALAAIYFEPEAAYWQNVLFSGGFGIVFELTLEYGGRYVRYVTAQETKEVSLEAEKAVILAKATDYIEKEGAELLAAKEAAEKKQANAEEALKKSNDKVIDLQKRLDDAGKAAAFNEQAFAYEMYKAANAALITKDDEKQPKLVSLKNQFAKIFVSALLPATRNAANGNGAVLNKVLSTALNLSYEALMFYPQSEKEAVLKEHETEKGSEFYVSTFEGEGTEAKEYRSYFSIDWEGMRRAYHTSTVNDHIRAEENLRAKKVEESKKTAETPKTPEGKPTSPNGGKQTWRGDNRGNRVVNR